MVPGRPLAPFTHLHLVLPRQLFEETFIPEAPTFMPNTRAWRRERGAFEELDPDLSAADRATKAYTLAFGSAAAGAGEECRAGWKRYTVADFYRAYSSGNVTPVQVAENVIAAVEEGMSQVCTAAVSNNLGSGRAVRACQCV